MNCSNAGCEHSNFLFCPNLDREAWRGVDVLMMDLNVGDVHLDSLSKCIDSREKLPTR